MNIDLRTILFVGLFFTTWVIGGNVLLAFHYRRMGKPWTTAFKPFQFPFKDFNAKEWLILLALAVLAFVFGSQAMSGKA